VGSLSGPPLVAEFLFEKVQLRHVVQQCLKTLLRQQTVRVDVGVRLDGIEFRRADSGEFVEVDEVHAALAPRSGVRSRTSKAS
jgi:hypothetical protein